MYNLIILGVCVVLYFLVNLILAKFFKQVAYAKGFDDKCHAWALVFWLGIFGCIYVCALPDLTLRKQNAEVLSHLQETDTIVRQNLLPAAEENGEEDRDRVREKIGGFVSDAKETIGNLKEQIKDGKGSEDDQGLLDKAADALGELKEKANALKTDVADKVVDVVENVTEKAEETVEVVDEAVKETITKE